jgi:tripartite ATP-independent transporter DctM subunit
MKTHRWVLLAVDTLTILAVVTMTVVVLVDVFRRIVTGASFLWLPDLSEFILGVITFFGAASAYGRNEHPAMLSFVDRLPERWRDYQRGISHWTVIGISVVCIEGSKPLAQIQWNQPSPVLGIPLGWGIVAMIVGIGFIVVLAALAMLNLGWRVTLTTGMPIVAVVAVIDLLSNQWKPWVGSHLIWVMLITLAVLICIGIPVAFVLAIDAFIGVLAAGSVPLNVLPQNMHDGITLNPVMLAIPFFIFAGFIMDKGGLASRLLDFLQKLMGHLPGGINHVVVVAMVIVSGMSGSKAADMTAVGTPLRAGAVADGPEAEEMVAVLASSAAMGETIPPSIPMLVLGGITTLSVGTLFLAGIVPALMLAVLLMITVAIRALRSGQKRPERTRLPELWRAFLKSIIPGLMPVVLIVGIIGGIATPEEVAAVAVLYGVLAGLAYRELNLKAAISALRSTAAMTGMVLFITATAAGFSWILTIENIGNQIASWLQSLPGGRPTFILMSCLIMVVMGMLFEGLPALYVFTPLLLPPALALGLNGVQFGIVLIIGLGIGCFAPPIGMGFYMASGIGRAEAARVVPRLMVYLGVLVIGYLLVAYVPAISLTLPHLLGQK